jgi:hypothetical protein
MTLKRHTLRINALSLAILGSAFCLFFQVSKHQPRWSGVNPFGDDPYDSVASYAVQFVLFLVVISLVRAFRRYSLDTDSQARAATQVRGQLMACVAIAFTLVADLIAMLRHPGAWTGRRAGLELLAITVCLLAWTASATALLLLSTRVLSLPPFRFIWIKLLAVPAGAFLVLAFYPEALRLKLPTEIVTVLCGMVLLFVVVWAIGTAFAPAFAVSSDLFDDLASIGSSLAEKLRIRRAPTTGKSSPSGSTPLFGWLNPRWHRWNIVFVVGILFGTFLVAQELADSGPSPHGSKRLLVIAVYLGLETAGVLTGYALLAEPLVSSGAIETVRAQPTMAPTLLRRQLRLAVTR